MDIVAPIFGGGQSTSINPATIPAPDIPKFQPITIPTPAAPAFRGAGFTGGGLNATVGPGGVALNATPGRTSLVQGLSDALKSYGTNLGSLLPQVQAGSGQLSKAIQDAFAVARQTLANRRQATIGNLKENLAQRRISGSSFASDAVARAEAEFANAEKDLASQEGTAAGQGFLQELSLTTDLLGKQAQAYSDSFNANLGELNLQAGVAQQLGSQVNQILAGNATLQAQLTAAAKLAEGQINAQGQITDINAILQKYGIQTGAATNQAKLNAGENAGAGQLLGEAGKLGTLLYLFA